MQINITTPQTEDITAQNNGTKSPTENITAQLGWDKPQTEDITARKKHWDKTSNTGYNSPTTLGQT